MPWLRIFSPVFRLFLCRQLPTYIRISIVFSFDHQKKNIISFFVRQDHRPGSFHKVAVLVILVIQVRNDILIERSWMLVDIGTMSRKDAHDGELIDRTLMDQFIVKSPECLESIPGERACLVVLRIVDVVRGAPGRKRKGSDRFVVVVIHGVIGEISMCTVMLQDLIQLILFVLKMIGRAGHKDCNVFQPIVAINDMVQIGVIAHTDIFKVMMRMILCDCRNRILGLGINIEFLSWDGRKGLR